MPRLLPLLVAVTAGSSLLIQLHAEPTFATSFSSSPTSAARRTRATRYKAFHIRGGAVAAKSSTASKKKVVVVHHAEELMSAPTAVANVLADLCPHGMLPIGKKHVLDLVFFCVFVCACQMIQLVSRSAPSISPHNPSIIIHDHRVLKSFG
jgi:hypothetical protein